MEASSTNTEATMREDNMAFKKKLHETKIQEARRHNLQWACGLSALVAALVLLSARYLG
jgi:hypothetical protein